MTARSWLAAPLMVLASLGSAANAETLEITGYVGVLGEWELTARVTAGQVTASTGGTKEYAGPLKMRHVGYCTQDGPEERTGQIRLSLSGTSRLTGHCS